NPMVSGRLIVVGCVFALSAALFSPSLARAQTNPLTDAPANAAGANSAGVERGAGVEQSISPLLTAATIALLIPAGLALVFGGMSRAKNAADAFALTLIIVPLAALAFFVFGFALGWGNAAGTTPPANLASLVGHPPPGVLDRGFGLGADANNNLAFGLVGASG